VEQSRPQPELDRTVAFRPAWIPLQDRVFAEHAAGFVEETAGDLDARPGAVPPPAPLRPAPTQSLSARLRDRFERE
jgi:hypothetical protein